MSIPNRLRGFGRLSGLDELYQNFIGSVVMVAGERR